MVGSVIGPYRITRLLGEGGMSAVYEAVNESIERRVAIKVLHPDFANRADVASRFLNEARAVNRIAHPSTVQIFEQGRLPDGAAYIVMEFLEGETLEARLAGSEGGLPLLTALLIGWQVAAALEAAHAKGIIHRDLKPSNLMLVPDPLGPGGERVKVLDFGIAKLVADAQKGHGRTSAEIIMGTPAYMSPEQCHGADAVDERSDVYSLGVILFEMIAGQPPFKGEGSGQLIGAHLFKPPPLLGELNAEVPDEVSQLVAMMLDKNKDERPSMRDVLDCLTELTSQGETSPTEIRRRATVLEPPKARPTALTGVPALPGVTGLSGPHKKPLESAQLPIFRPASALASQVPQAPQAPKMSQSLQALQAAKLSRSQQAVPAPVIDDISHQEPPKPKVSWTRLIGFGLIGAGLAGGLVLLAHSYMQPVLHKQPQVLPPDSTVVVPPPPNDAGQARASTRERAADPMVSVRRPLRPASVHLPPLRNSDVRPIEQRPVGVPMGAGAAPGQGPVATGPAAQLRNPLQDKPGVSASGEADRVLSSAQAEYVGHNYARAIELAKSVQQASPIRAWRIIGSAACGTKNIPLLKESYTKVDQSGRQYLYFVCQRFGINTETLMGAGKK